MGTVREAMTSMQATKKRVRMAMTGHTCGGQWSL